MKRFWLPVVIVGLWLFAWADNTGVLVWSRQEPYGTGRLCSYFIGFSIETVYRPPHYRSRCALLARV
jgi:hypothetical protein